MQVMYIARYGRQQVDAVEVWDGCKRRRVMKALSRLIEQEHKAVKDAK